VIRLFFLFCESVLALLTICSSLHADPITIISAPAGLNGGGAVALGGNGFLGESWSSLNSYLNVNISAPLTRAPCCPTDPVVSIIAYLTSQIGPGTTIANQIATATVAVPGLGPDAAYTTLFSGLTLGPGNYFLTLAAADPADAGTAAWWYNVFGQRISTDAGVGWLGAYGVNGVPDLSYPPASLFSANLNSSFATGLNVVGEAAPSTVPESSTFAILALGFFALARFKSRKARLLCLTRATEPHRF
jgi:hypothetical protein